MTAGGFEIFVDGRRRVIPPTHVGNWYELAPLKRGASYWVDEGISKMPAPEPHQVFERHGDFPVTWYCPKGVRGCCVWADRVRRGPENLSLELAERYVHPIAGPFTLDVGVWCMRVSP